MHNWKQALLADPGGGSKYKRLVAVIVADIEQGSLREDQRLPPQRLLADQLGISVQTVTNAYKELERQGWVRCEVGRGSFVSRRSSERVARSMLDRGEHSLFDCSTARIIRTDSHDRHWRQVCGALAGEAEQPWIHTCRPIAGFERHREAGVQWLAGLGLTVRPRDLLLTNGTSQAIFLALAALARPDDLVLCEHCTDHGVIGTAQVLGFKLQGLDADQQGIDPEHFEDVCANERVTALVCTPNLNNPTSSVMPDARRRAIADIAQRYGVYVIEDDVYGPLLGAHRQAPPISHYLPDLSFYCTSFTKSVLTGLRLGYLAMPRRLALRTESILRVNSWMAPPLLGEIATRWIEGGEAMALVRLQRELIATRQAAVSAELGDYLHGSHPASLSAWLNVPEHWDLDALQHELRHEGIALTLPDPFLAPGWPRPRAMRLCIGVEGDEQRFRSGLASVRDIFEQYPDIHAFRGSR